MVLEVKESKQRYATVFHMVALMHIFYLLKKIYFGIKMLTKIVDLKDLLSNILAVFLINQKFVTKIK